MSFCLGYSTLMRRYCPWVTSDPECIPRNELILLLWTPAFWQAFLQSWMVCGTSWNAVFGAILFDFSILCTGVKELILDDQKDSESNACLGQKVKESALGS